MEKRELLFKAWHSTNGMSREFGLSSFPAWGEDNQILVPYWKDMCRILQYTGMKDSEGEKIFGNDIQKIMVNHPAGHIDEWDCVVLWDNILCRYVWQSIKHKNIYVPDEIIYKKTIGNTVDNQELLKTEEK